MKRTLVVLFAVLLILVIGQMAWADNGPTERPAETATPVATPSPSATPAADSTPDNGPLPPAEDGIEEVSPPNPYPDRTDGKPQGWEKSVTPSGRQAAASGQPGAKATLQNNPGPRGLRGLSGHNGRDGKNGKDGKDGKNGIGGKDANAKGIYREIKKWNPASVSFVEARDQQIREDLGNQPDPDRIKKILLAIGLVVILGLLIIGGCLLVRF